MSEFRDVRRLFLMIGLLSAANNILLLAAPLYMLQVYDRVLSGRSLETLLYLSLAVIVAMTAMAGLDVCRSLILARAGDWLDRHLGPKVMAASIDMAAQPKARYSLQPLTDLSQVRQFVSSPGVNGFFDVPWMPFFILLIWLLHPLLGMVAIGGAIVLAILAYTGEVMTRKRTDDVTLATTGTQGLYEIALANADVARSMGLLGKLKTRLAGLYDHQSDLTLRNTSRIGTLTAISKAFRLAMQSGILGAGAYLVVIRELSPGEMIAASIVLSRALAPVEAAIGSWRPFVNSRRAWKRLSNLVDIASREAQGLKLPEPKGELKLSKVVLQTGPGTKPILQNITFEMPAGERLGVVGSSGSGKSSLGRILVGAWRANSGSVRLDGAELSQWDKDELGKHIGYLPQSIDLFPGTILQNISRFTDGPLEDAIEAAKLASAHEVILQLPGGYDCEVGNRGERLSGGQRQRIALARAVYGGPKLLVLDEPDSNLDQTGHEGLMKCLDALQARGVSIVLIAHRRPILERCTKLMWLRDGQLAAYGAPAKVVEHMNEQRKGATQQQHPQPPQPQQRQRPASAAGAKGGMSASVAPNAAGGGFKPAQPKPETPKTEATDSETQKADASGADKSGEDKTGEDRR
jgi:PrtD family type I secretion system ABC transporter